MDLKRVLFLMSIVLKLYVTDCLECYSCSNKSHVSQCLTTIKCPPGQMCHTVVSSYRYTLGCSNHCPAVSTSIPGGQIVGRALTSRANADCSDCCETAMCNRQLCQVNDPTCHDSGHVDCAVTGSFVDVCAKTDHAKQECRRFCGLCSMVDGAWSNWSAWSSCSTTCGKGTVSRTRSCTNPAPADDGSDCIGTTNDNNTCANDALCPVNGGWSDWSQWGSCSVTCGIGLQPRHRTCSSPYPSNFGEHCYGESREDRICLARACQDGGWTDWGGWTYCSKTCDSGTRKRSRSCSNPSPSVLGRYCTGDPSQVDNCADKPCHEQAIGFTVHSPKNAATPGHITFTEVLINQGGGYNTTTGEFTCSVAGVYSFSLTILKQISAYTAYCSIYKNSQHLGQADVDSRSNSIGYMPGSNTVYVHLQHGDKVSTKGCTDASTIYALNHVSTFTGYLIHSD